MYHPPPKRKQMVRRVVVYGLMTTAVVTLVTVLILIMLGYQFNRADGRIEQGGLVQFNSRPTGANITIDGANFNARTPSKTTVAAGSHHITMSRNGYLPWQKTVDVVPGAVLWLNYARLVPAELKPENVMSFSAVSSTSASPDRKRMAIKEEPATPVIKLTILDTDTVRTSNLEIPQSSYTPPAEGKPHVFTVVSWDHESRYLLLKHEYNDGALEWLVMDTQNPSRTTNITKLLDMPASRVVFSGNNNRVLYVQTGHDIRKVDVSASSVSRPLVSQVAEFSIYNNTTIVYTTLWNEETKTRQIGYYTDGSQRLHTVRTVSDEGDIPLHLTIGKYFGDTYVVIAHGNKTEVFSADLPTGDDPAKPKLKLLTSFTTSDAVQHLSIRSEGRFVVAESKDKFSVYDLELKRTTTTDLKGTPRSKKLNWLDAYTVWTDRDGRLRIYEFDGANQHEIMRVVPGYDVVLSPNERYLYGINRSGDSWHLTRVRMVL